MNGRVMDAIVIVALILSGLSSARAQDQAVPPGQGQTAEVQPAAPRTEYEVVLVRTYPLFHPRLVVRVRKPPEAEQRARGIGRALGDPGAWSVRQTVAAPAGPGGTRGLPEAESVPIRAVDDTSQPGYTLLLLDRKALLKAGTGTRRLAITPPWESSGEEQTSGGGRGIAPEGNAATSPKKPGAGQAGAGAAGAGQSQKPGAGQAAKPGAGEAKPSAGETKPGAGEAKPSAGAAKPGAGQAARPGAGEAKPGAADTKPSSGQSKPGADKKKPGTGQAGDQTAAGGKPQAGAGQAKQGAGGGKTGAGVQPLNVSGPPASPFEQARFELDPAQVPNVKRLDNTTSRSAIHLGMTLEAADLGRTLAPHGVKEEGSASMPSPHRAYFTSNSMLSTEPLDKQANLGVTFGTLSHLHGWKPSKSAGAPAGPAKGKGGGRATPEEAAGSAATVNAQPASENRPGPPDVDDRALKTEFRVGGNQAWSDASAIAGLGLANPLGPNFMAGKFISPLLFSPEAPRMLFGVYYENRLKQDPRISGAHANANGMQIAGDIHFGLVLFPHKTRADSADTVGGKTWAQALNQYDQDSSKNIRLEIHTGGWYFPLDRGGGATTVRHFEGRLDAALWFPIDSPILKHDSGPGMSVVFRYIDGADPLVHFTHSAYFTIGIVSNTLFGSIWK